MRITLSNSSPEPLYDQIVRQIRAQIISGDLAESSPLPSIRKLAHDLQISVTTTKRAYEELEKEGLIDTGGGGGARPRAHSGSTPSFWADQLAADRLQRRCLARLNASDLRVLEQDLELASRIQLGLLPPRECSALGWEIAYHFEPYGHVGGDYCDVVLPGPHGSSLFFLLGDVSGKGVAASLLMSNLHATIRSLTSAGLGVEQVMTRANRLFCRPALTPHYATLVCGRSTASGEIELANAGHWPVAHVRRDRTQFVDSSGLALGMFCSSEYRHQRLRLDPGDFLVLYTDGLTEARNRADEEYGTDRLAARLGELARQPHLTARDVTTACLRDMATFRGGTPASDDLTIMVVRRSGRVS